MMLRKERKPSLNARELQVEEERPVVKRRRREKRVQAQSARRLSESLQQRQERLQREAYISEC